MTTGLNTIARSLDLKPGDEILTTPSCRVITSTTRQDMPAHASIYVAFS
jgi:hypothetical protein